MAEFLHLYGIEICFISLHDHILFSGMGLCFKEQLMDF